MRISHALATSGIGSRRKCETYVRNGAVSVNGEIVRDLGRQVDLENDSVMYRGKLLHAPQKVFFILNKPVGYTVTAKDPYVSKTVFDLLPRKFVSSSKECKGTRTRVFPVGRLDKDSSGALLFTNDGYTANRLLHPSNHVVKVYDVKLDHAWNPVFGSKILKGVPSCDGLLKVQSFRPLTKRILRICIGEGKNRQIRRIFEFLNYNVTSLHRISFGPIRIANLAQGSGRFLTSQEINQLKNFLTKKT